MYFYIIRNLKVFNQNIMKCTQLIEICMANVRMVGTISNSVPQPMPNLETINLANNKLTGTIFIQWGIFYIFTCFKENLPNLVNFEVSGNKFTELLPTNLQSAINLQVIDISYNNFTGNFPLLTQLTQIKYMDIRQNNFTGTFPNEYFAADSFTKLQFIGLASNDYLTIPDVCIRLPFCYKQTVLLKQESGDTISSLDSETMQYIDNSEYYEQGSVTDIP